MISNYKKSLRVLHDKASNHDRPLVELLQKDNDKFVISLKTGNSSLTFPELETEDISALHKILSLRPSLLTIALSLMHNLTEDKLKETVNALDKIADK